MLWRFIKALVLRPASCLALVVFLMVLLLIIVIQWPHLAALFL